MAAKYSEARAVRVIAEKLIREHHQHLAKQRIEYLFVDPTPTKNRRIVMGQMRKIGGLQSYLAGEEGSEPFFCMTIAEEVWATLSEAQKVALVDHELCHAGVEEDEDGNLKLHIIGHDLEEFRDVVKRHGLWDEGLTKFVAVANERQELLPFERAS